MFNPETDLQLPKIMSQTEERGVEKINKRFAKQVHPRLTRSLLVATKTIHIHTYVYLEFIEIVVINRRSIN